MMFSIPLLFLLATLGSIFSLLFVFFIRSNCMVVTIKQSSMYPTLVPEDRILALRRWSPDRLRKGQIVILKMDHLPLSVAGPDSSSSTLYMKRIVGVAGETFATTQAGEERVPDKEYIADNPDQRVWHIPPASILVRGDNRTASLDSHIWGPVPVRCVQAIMLVRLHRNARARSHRTNKHLFFPSLAIGENAPVFEAATLHDEIVNFQTYKDYHLLLVFFQPTHVLTEQFFRRHWRIRETIKDETQIILVSGASAKQTRTFLEKMQVDLPVLIAPRQKNPMFKDYKIYNIPYYYYIDDHGKILSAGIIPLSG